ncbi:MAG: 1-(5-phosphoribosyl)-5-[(5-phosphoribosylamino)methylideneamino]imidazole-4-carboxamide isomerase [Chthoniobacterales bacterium]|nr:1-(5-phosphoribosyl)-5-[(5-phosphoribosylamino)methylideneamino]imidazole-4-carboxamide isomerase [Chthoniobacterales bacterium]
MLLYPAIDLMDGKAVRLKQGRAADKTVYSDDPVSVARDWETRGGDWLHVVDLDAAFEGRQANLDVVRRMASAISVPLQLGGGMRDDVAIRKALDAGAARVVIGTRAAEAPDFVAGAVKKFGGDRIAVGIDAKDGFVAVKGWTEVTGLAAIDFARKMHACGVGAIICTDIATDGMLQGPNFQSVEDMVCAVDCPVIASGGVSSALDLARLARIPRLSGAIIGRALFDGCITGDLRAAMARAAAEAGL